MLATSCGGRGSSRTVTVFAAASLTGAFGDAAHAFEASHTGVGVRFSFAGSPTLRTQLDQGARADLLATADEPNMQAALEQGIVRDAGMTFARNRLAIVRPNSNPGAVSTPRDLAKSGLRLVLAASDVPVGRYARESLAKMAADPSFPAGFSDGALANVVSEEPNVKAVLAAVQLGEADAGIVYATDLTPEIARDVTAIDIPDAYNVVASYPIAITTDAAEPELAQEYTDFLLSDEGQAILKRYGFIGVK
jgi:molybdate transport system substrate-binding protein